MSEQKNSLIIILRYLVREEMKQVVWIAHIMYCKYNNKTTSHSNIHIQLRHPYI